MTPLLHTLVVLTLSGTAAGGKAPRYFPKFGGNRHVELLDGEWSYGLHLEKNFDAMNKAFTPDASKVPNKTNVPSCMDVVAGGAPGYMGPRGVAMYSTKFTAPPATVPQQIGGRLQFQSCSFYCRVWVNGKEVGKLAGKNEWEGHRAGGYVAFYVDVRNEILKEGEPNELFVLADNRFNHTTAPMHTGGDFWHYGGLTRSVELHILSSDRPMLWRAWVLPSRSDDIPKAVDITLALTEDEEDYNPVNFTLAFDDDEPATYTGHFHGIGDFGQLTISNVPVPNAKIWSTDEPNLHTVTVGFRGSYITERFGLRRFGVDKASSRLTINGKVQKIVGWNHHTQWPVTGASPTDEQLDADIKLLKDAGATYVRGAHYPHDPRMLDRLDEAGILFWSETLGPGVKVHNLQDRDFFMLYQGLQLEEMMDNAINHASIMAWGWFNEGPSDKAEACPAYEEQAKYARDRDPTRFTTWADNKGTKSKCLASASLISFNNYPGWYNRPGDLKAPAEEWTSRAAKVRAGTTRSGNATLGKPFVISETGAGGVYEWDANSTDAKWTLKYQTEVIAADVDVAIADQNISGITLWHFYDFKVNDGEENNTHCVYDHPPPETFQDLAKFGPPNCTHIDINHRPGGENHKGSLDFWRREKPVFRVVATKYKALQNSKQQAEVSLLV